MLTEILELLKQNGEVDIHFPMEERKTISSIKLINFENHLLICWEKLNNSILDTSNFSLSKLLLSVIKDDPIMITSNGNKSSNKEEDIYNEFYYLISSMLDNILTHHINLLESEDIVDILSDVAKPYQKGIDKSYTFKEILLRLQFKLRAAQLKYDCYQVDKHQTEELRKSKKNLLLK